MSLCVYANSIYEAVLHMETVYADRVAIQYYDEATQGVASVLYRQYAQDIRRFVAYLQRNIPDLQNRRVAILAKNSYHYAVALFGVSLSGAVLVPLNTAKSADELAYELERADVDCILHDGSYFAAGAEQAAALQQQYQGQWLDLHGFTAEPELAQLHEVQDPARLAFIMFTSGTTGRSKGVMLSHKNLFAGMSLWADFDLMREKMGLPLDYHLSSFNVLPMFHIAAFTSTVSWAIGGNTVNLCLDLKYFYRDLGLMDSDMMAVVPVLLKSIHHDVVKGKRARLGKLRALSCAAAMFDPAMLTDMIDNGFFIMQMYGLTEACGNGTMNLSNTPQHLGSVGLPGPNCEFRPLEESGGELCIRGAGVMLGYCKDPAATAEVLDADGWLHTGDLVHIAEDGYVYITGRKKNLIILSSGENVSPEELEALLAQCADLTEALVKEKGDKICAVVCCEAAKQEAVRAFITELNRTLPLYKRITAVEFSAQPLPRNATGKLVRQ
jgi:long-subunit acyl-CoA synthetase (AMP-forming)